GTAPSRGAPDAPPRAAREPAPHCAVALGTARAPAPGRVSPGALASLPTAARRELRHGGDRRAHVARELVGEQRTRAGRVLRVVEGGRAFLAAEPEAQALLLAIRLEAAHLAAGLQRRLELAAAGRLGRVGRRAPADFRRVVRVERHPEEALL